jgi:hypothetical protein
MHMDTSQGTDRLLKQVLANYQTSTLLFKSYVLNDIIPAN